MTSKTGWWPKGWQVDIREGTPKLYLGNAHGKRRRVCVRVDECPETMMRAELREKWNKHWLFRFQSGGKTRECRIEFIPSGEFLWHGGRLLDSCITHARPHDEAPWTTVEDG